MAKLIAHYPLNGDANDISGNENHAVPTGTPTFSSNGKIGKCFECASTLVYVPLSAGLRSVFSGTEFTISLWWYQTSNNTSWSDLIQYTDINGIDRRLELHNETSNPDKVGLWTNIGKGDLTYTSSIYDTDNFGIDKNEWFHLTLRRTKNSFDVFRNGLLLSSITPAGENICEINSNLNLNRHTINGSKVNDMRFYDGALSDKEIYDISKAKILHYSFNDMQEPTTNLISSQNPRIDESYQPYVATTSGLWQTNHPDAIRVYNESGAEITAYVNSGVTDWTNTYHAIWTFDSALSKPVVTMRDVDGMWKAKSFSMNKTMNDLSLGYGDTYTISWLQWTEDISKSAVTGVYGKNLSAQNGFHDGQSSSQSSSFNTLANTWQRVYATFTVSTVRDLSTTLTIYMYGHYHARATLKISDVQFETKDHATEFTPTSRTGSVTDKSGFGNHATLAESTTPRWVEESKTGSGAYEFQVNDRGSGYDDINQNIASSFYANSRQFTISAWVKHSTLDSSWRYPIVALTEANYSAVASSQQILLCIEANKPRVHFWGGADCIMPTSTNDNEWHHVAFTYDYDTRLVNMYLDGVKNISDFYTAESGMSINENHRWHIGCNPRGYHWGDNTSGYKTTFQGCIDNPQIFTTLLSDSDILYLYKERVNSDDKGTLSVNEIIEVKSKRLFADTTFSVQDQTYTQLGYFAGNAVIDEDVSDFLVGENNLGNVGLAGKVYISSLDYKPSTFEYTKNNNDLGGYFYFSEKTDWHLGWNNFLLKNFTYDDNVIGTPWTNMDRIEIYRTGGATGVDTTQFISFKDVRLIQFEDNSELTNTFNEKGKTMCLDFSEVGITDELVAYYPLESDPLDFSGNHYDGITNAVSFNGQESSFLSTNSSHIQTGWGSAIDPSISPLSISLLVKCSAITGQSMIVSSGQIGNINARLYIGNEGGQWDLGIHTSGWGLGATPVTTEWTHICLIMDGSSAKLYVDGVLSITKSYSSYILNRDIYFGTHDSSYYFSGSMRCAKIFSRALSPEEVAIEHKFLMQPNNDKMIITNDTLYVREIKEVL
jgi:hypothetical protein